MLCERLRSFENHDISVAVCDGEPWFRASDVTTAWGYTNGSQAVRTHVNILHVKTIEQLTAGPDSVSSILCPTENDGNAARSQITRTSGLRQPLYINEAGVYELMWHSKKVEALRFRQWIVEEVLPEIRKTGRFVRNEQVSLMCETDLHYKVVDFIRKFFVEAIVIPGLGELQDTEPKRLDAWNKGYKGGQPDILILNRTRKNSGLAIELKTPLCHRNPSEKQEAFLQNLRNIKYETLLSNSYDDIVVKIIEYREAVRRCNPVRKARSSVE